MVKKIIIYAAVIIGVGFWAWLDYFWGRHKIEGSNLTLICSKTEMTFYKPWTWFKEPITQILWVDEYNEITDQYYVASIVYAGKGREFEDGRDFHKSIDLIDVKNNKFASITIEKVKELDPFIPYEYDPDITWIKASGCMDDLVIYLKKSHYRKP